MVGRALAEFKKFMKGRFEKKVSFTLIGAGTAIAVSPFIPSIWDIVLWGLNNMSVLQNGEKPITNNNYVYKLFTVGIGLIFITLGLWFYFKTKEKAKKFNMLQIKHASLGATSYTKINKDLTEYNVFPYDINQVEDMKILDKDNLNYALKKQTDETKKILNRFNDSTEGDIEVAYFGLAYVPLVWLMGYQLSDKVTPMFFEWNQNDKSWNCIEDNKKNFSPMSIIREDSIEETQKTKEVVIKMAVSFPIQDKDLDGLNLDGLNNYYLHLTPPHRNSVINTVQLNNYKKMFRDLIDEIILKYPNLEKVHLFYAGQPSLAFTLASAISPRMDSKIEFWIYNNYKKAYPEYNWALKLDVNGESIVTKITAEEMVKNVQS